MFRKKITKKQYIVLLAVIAIATGAIANALSNGFSTKTDCYAIQVKAAGLMQNCMDEIKHQKTMNNIPISDEDYFSTGMLGEEHNFITTTLGDPAAKRTTSDPNMAALVVKILYDAGINVGDYVGCNFSGSFPAMNIATICACEAMGAVPVYMCSCGSSTYGANNPEYSFPEMISDIYKSGLIAHKPVLVTPGGGSDTGEGIDRELFSEIWDRVEKLGFNIMVEPDFEKNVSAKKEIYDNYDIKCFVVAGGNIASLGYNMAVDYLGQGLIEGKVVSVDEKSGLLERYLHTGVPCVLLLNIRQLLVDYDMPFDPDVHSEIGASGIYHVTQYPKTILIIALLAVSAILCIYKISEKKSKAMAIVEEK